VSGISKPDLSKDVLELGDAGARWVRLAAAAGVVGVVAALALAALQEGGWARFSHAWLLNWSFAVSLSVGALFWVLISHLTRAGWNVVLRRFAESVAWALIPLAALGVPVVLGMHDLYYWTHADAVAADPVLMGKRPWLNEPFFVGRLVAYFVIWGLTIRWFAAKSVEQDRTGEPGITVRMEKTSAWSMVVFALTTTFFAIDVLMTLNPHWFSTIWGVYFFSGCAVGFFSFLALLLHGVQRSGRIREAITIEHFHDIGKLAFAFVVFWAYIAFSQYMLIWYAHMPEETIFYAVRQAGPWTAVSVALLVGHFAVPFVALLSRLPKRRPRMLAVAAVWLLAMHWLDLFWIVMPEAYPAKLPLGLMELALLAGVGGLFLAAVFWKMGRQSLVPVGDPRLDEALRFENV
jgi:hypothetical protein